MRATHFVHALERVAGIEPARSAWKAGVLPLNYTRETSRVTREFFLPILSYYRRQTSTPICAKSTKNREPTTCLNLGDFSQQVFRISSVHCLLLLCCVQARPFKPNHRFTGPATRPKPLPELVEGGGFEPPKLSRQIYSLIPLAAREPLQQSIRRFYYPWHFYTGAAF
jgi:hypothetical protein